MVCIVEIKNTTMGKDLGHSYQDRLISQRIEIWNVRPKTGVVFVSERNGTSSRSENWVIRFERGTTYTGETKGKKG